MKRKFDKQLKKGIPLSEYYSLIAEIEKLPKNVYFYNVAPTMLVLASTQKGMENLDIAGNKILGIGRKVGYWTVAIVATFQIIKSIRNGDREKTLTVLTDAAIAFGSLYFVTFILDLIKETLG